ncbi:MAG: hypothetical protein A2161_03135 [Candidatus Schekmanbacteria bacterium RBG_13_48_7]|uniref:Group II intron maturase-specific domain-containing protein n=1 Tax=Candidatus Schekmanbacteria bacterium RBG_13_48_7 TaxID=1817878 RepID=A0A1F7RXU8_9BACT|nr:MAG: hypothetical protein A2161_03135 [Candidatus Schekmanbacteria bacterium RBG_13_48_7]
MSLIYLRKYAAKNIPGNQIEQNKKAITNFSKLLRLGFGWITYKRGKYQPKNPLAKFGLELQESKTRLIEFGRYAIENGRASGKGKPETFDFLGFTHICSKRWKDGRFTVRRNTIAKRLLAKLKEVRKVLMRNRHAPVPEQGK